MEKKSRLVVICDVKRMFQRSLFVFFILGVVATIAFYYVNMDEQSTDIPLVPSAYTYNSLDGCDLFSGKWVYDNDSYPLYRELQCPYITGDFACGKYGRMDSIYQEWRWQPHTCTLPRFDAKEVLERLMNKRVIFVGDSVNRNQWVSMVCMLQTVIPVERQVMERINPHVSLLSFKALGKFSTENSSCGFA
ncbi:hypothetical protein L2E82_11587 [Cichorium intybus]|uniref:Uncharacterized protein n=1 Tax=Cichorium intybus TaxID=13427 RepID=A0ACB9GES7_CICIN|nr:hypothetical protein L2E82_11587 [Cichorium intybus]